VRVENLKMCIRLARCATTYWMLALGGKAQSNHIDCADDVLAGTGERKEEGVKGDEMKSRHMCAI
jgi:hypothetical protein